jgi:hypothetical protein
MQSTEQLARADEERRAYLDNEARKSRECKRARKYIGHPKGVTKVELPTNWEDINNAILRHIKHEHMKELRTITSCVADLLGIYPAAVGRAIGVSSQRVVMDVQRQHCRANAWMKIEAKRIEALCPRPVYAEGKAG